MSICPQTLLNGFESYLLGFLTSVDQFERSSDYDLNIETPGGVVPDF